MFTTNCKNDLGTVNYILYSTDNGAHWRLSNAVAYTGTDESKLEQRNDGSLLLSVRQSGNRGWNTATYTKNADGTVTFNWGTQTRTGDIWGNACNADILYYSRQSDTDPDILLHSYINTSGRQSLQISRSSCPAAMSPCSLRTSPTAPATAMPSTSSPSPASKSSTGSSRPAVSCPSASDSPPWTKPRVQSSMIKVQRSTTSPVSS